MGDRAALIWGQPCSLYDFGRDHPLRPERVFLAVELIRATGLLERPGVEVQAPISATDEEIALVHDAGYIELVRRAGAAAGRPWDAARELGPEGRKAGLGWGDNPIFPGMHEATAWVVGASLAAARAVVSGGAHHAFNPAGGLHHAGRARASGFCIYNDVAVAVAWIRQQRPHWRVLYVDVDVHHGDGVQEIFWEDPQVLTISFHESGDFLFPGTGFIDELGGKRARGSAVNLPLPPGTTDREYLEALESLLPELASAFRPDVLVSQLGCDTHWRDPLAHLRLTMRAYPRIYALLHDLAHTHCEGRWAATGGGGYDWARAVPRAWTLAFAEMCAQRPGEGPRLLPEEVPPEWPSVELPVARPRTFLQDDEVGETPSGQVPASLRDLRRRLGLPEFS
jgi:acetoin utilization protein AcuC